MWLSCRARGYSEVEGQPLSRPLGGPFGLDEVLHAHHPLLELTLGIGPEKHCHHMPQGSHRGVIGHSQIHRRASVRGAKPDQSRMLDGLSGQGLPFQQLIGDLPGSGGVPLHGHVSGSGQFPV